MSLSALEKLMFTVGIQDLTSKPAQNINRTLLGMKQNANSGFDAIRGGAFGLAGAGIAIKTFMQPVADFQKSIGEVKSLDVAQKEIDTLTKVGLNFSMQYGESASDFVKSSYDIQSAIGGLANGELAKFTLASNILAKGTKADAATITNYMGTMYGIFSDQAEKMGKAKWVEQLTGQTAAAVQMFKTDGVNMSGAFTAIGANATASGVALNEQMAILGTLQSTMSGSEAGTKYKAFLAGVAGAQDKLGLSFTDSQGRLLPMVDILTKLNSKFGDTLSEAEGLQLKKAFGSDEATSLLKLLMGQTDGLANSINKLGKVNGMQQAERMAKNMVDPWEQFQTVTEAVRISFGTALMPTINDLMATLNGGLQNLIFYTQEFPNITRWVGLLTLAMLGMSAATGLFSIVLGLGKTAMAAWGAGVLAFKGIMFVLLNVFKAMRVAVILFNIAMLLNPVGVVTVLIAGLVAAVVGLVAWLGNAFGWWGKLKNAFADTTFGQAIIGWFEKLMGYFEKFKSWMGIGDELSATINKNESIMQTQKIEPLEQMKSPQEMGAGLGQQIQAMLSGQGGAQFGDVYITAEGGMSPDNMENWQALQGG